MTSNGDGSKELWLTELGPLFFPPTPVVYISNQGYSESQVANWLGLTYTNWNSFACPIRVVEGPTGCKARVHIEANLNRIRSDVGEVHTVPGVGGEVGVVYSSAAGQCVYREVVSNACARRQI